MSDTNQPNDAAADPSAWDDSRITAYVMGELSAEDTTAFESELSCDPALREALDQAGRVTDQLKDLYAGETPGKLEGDRREQILAATNRSTESIKPASLENAASPRRIVPWLLAAAATLLLAIGLVPALNRPQMALNQTNQSIDKVVVLEMETEDESAMQMASQDGEASLHSRASDVTANVQPQRGASRVAVVKPQPGAAESKRSLTESKATGRLLKSQISGGAKLAKKNLDANLSAAAAPLNAAPLSAAPLSAAPLSDPKVRALKGFELAGRQPALAAPTVTPAPAAAPTPAPAAAPAAAPTPAPAAAPAAAPAGMMPGQPMRRKAKGAPFQVPGQRSSEVEFGYRSSRSRTSERSDSFAPPVDDRTPQVWSESKNLELQDGDRFEPIVENEFKQVSQHPLSTFSIDVDTASYSKVRRTLVGGRLPRPDAVRIEELVNYFDYHYDVPADDAEHPFAADVSIASCPWNETHRLARVAIQGKTIERESRPPCNLVFLLDTSGSMNSTNKLPLVIEGMKMLTKQLDDDDRVAIVVYAGSAGMVLDSTPAGKHKKIKKALTQLSAGGSTNGGAGIQLAYATARDHFIKDGVNRVILCTDGDFNVGMSGTDQLVRLIKEEASGGIFLTALGFGMGNHNDAMMEQISGKGNGNYAFIDTANEARKVLVRQTNATLVTIAKDVKLQIEFNPRIVSQYRLIGYENRVMAKEDFNNDQKDAGEIGAGHQVTALYELVPAVDVATVAEPTVAEPATVDPLKYQKSPELTAAASGGDAMTIKLRYKQPDGDTSTLIQFNAKDSEQTFVQADAEFRFVASVASFGMLLRGSEYAGDWTLQKVRQIAEANIGKDEFKLRAEFVELVRAAIRLRGGE